MAKIGKYSTGIKGSVKKASSPYGESNKGWGGRSNMTKSFNEMTPRQRPRKTYVGAAQETSAKR